MNNVYIALLVSVLSFISRDCVAQSQDSVVCYSNNLESKLNNAGNYQTFVYDFAHISVQDKSADTSVFQVIKAFPNVKNLEIRNANFQVLPSYLEKFDFESVTLQGNKSLNIEQALSVLNKSTIKYLYIDGVLNNLPTIVFHFKHLITLSIENSRIFNIESDLANLSRLKILILKNNAIHNLKVDFSKFPYLEELDISHNDIQITKIDFSGLLSIKRLNISHNQLNIRNVGWKKFCKNMEQTQLEELDISSSHIHEFPYQLGTLKYLKRLYIYENNIKNKPIQDKTQNNLFPSLEILQFSPQKNYQIDNSYYFYKAIVW